MAFIVGSGTFTNGSKNVTGVSVTSGVLVNIASGTMLSVGTDPVEATVEAIAAPSETTITLRENWPLTTGTYDLTATFTPEGIRDGIQSLRDATTALNDAEATYITSADAASTYLAQADAASTYFTQADAGTAAEVDIVEETTDQNIGRALIVSSAGIIRDNLLSVDINTPQYNKGFGKYFCTSTATGNPFGAACHVIELGSDSTSRVSQIVLKFSGGTGDLQIGARTNTSESFVEFWHSGNTTVDGSGFIKEASPIVKLYYDHADFNDQCPKNAEFEKVSTGHYLIKNTLGFAQKGWYIENPKDANGNVKVYVDFQQLEDNTLEIKTYEPDYSSGKCMAGVPADIPEGRWIDLRLEVEPVTINETNEEI